MKTKSWKPVEIFAEESSQPVAFAITQPTFFEDRDGNVIGPVALGLAMLKGMELARSLTPFRISDEENRTLLELRGNDLSGEEALVPMLQEMLEVSGSLYSSYYATIRAELEAELSQDGRRG